MNVLTTERKQIKVLLAGIDAPESGQDFEARARQFASVLAFGKTVEIRAQRLHAICKRGPWRKTILENSAPRDGRSGVE